MAEKIDGKQEAALTVIDRPAKMETFVVYEARLKLNGGPSIVEIAVDGRGQNYLSEFYTNPCVPHHVMLKCMSKDKDNSLLALNLDHNFVVQHDLRVGDLIEIDMGSSPPTFLRVRLDIRPAWAKPIIYPGSVYYSLGALKVQS